MPTRNRSGRWLSILCLLIVLAFATVIAVGMFNMRNRLTAEALDQAQKKWRDSGPADYTLTYTIERRGTTGPDRYVVKVRNKRAVEATVNGLPEPADRLVYYGMNALFKYIQDFQDLDGKGKDKAKDDSALTRASFDDQTGALVWYSRRKLGSDEHVDLTVESLTPEKGE
ncbi:MAG: hypothetical protein HY040_01720 [Planctomycetes bacterium]|nr:hypothetical protein [Planctomycetota bacterium]